MLVGVFVGVLVRVSVGVTVSVDVGDVGVVSEIAKGNKCVRCYRVLPEVGTISGHEMTCGRCADAVAEYLALSE